MKKRTLILISLILVSMVRTYSQKELKLTNMHLFPEGKLIEDSSRTIKFMPFYLSNQITNIEFKEFWNYAKSNPDKELEWADMSNTSDKNSKPQPTIKKIKYSELIRIPFNQENWPIDNYFESEKYNNSPVIGVPKDLAGYYCIWCTYKFNEDFKENKKNSTSTFYLPSESQLKYAQNTEPSLFSENEIGFRIMTLK